MTRAHFFVIITRVYLTVTTRYNSGFKSFGLTVIILFDLEHDM